MRAKQYAGGMRITLLDQYQQRRVLYNQSTSETLEISGQGANKNLHLNDQIFK